MWIIIIICRSVAQLFAAVPSPPPNRPVGLERQPVTETCGDVDDIYQIFDRHRRALPPRRRLIERAVAQLTVLVVAPGLYRAVEFERQTVPGASGNSDDTRQTAHVHGCISLPC